MKIRDAALADVDKIVELAVEFEHYLLEIDDSLISVCPPPEVFRKVMSEGLDDKKHHFFVAESDGQIIGFIDFWAYPEFMHGGLSGYLNNLYVREEFRGKGIGSQLLNKCMEAARELGVVAMHVPVKSKNVRAIEFYKKMGIGEQLAMMETRFDR